MPVRPVDPLVLALDEHAARIDRDGGLPRGGVALLRQAELLAMPLPTALGGRGLGTEAAGALKLLALLRRIGRADLSMGRLFEGHVNAIRLVVRYGQPAQRERLAESVRAGQLLGLWVTDDVPLRLRRQDAGWVLDGQKSFCSGVGLATSALITVQPETGLPRMALVPVGSDVGSGASPSMAGMRGAATARYDFSGVSLPDEALIGAPGDYLRQPDFSAGAWRGSAVALGGIDRLVDELRAQLSARGRAGNPHQLARIGEALIERETAGFWCRRAALLAEGEGFETADVQATVNLARIACERSGLRVIELVQRGLGLQAFLRSGPVERVMRDLATYLRQPAPDETLTEAAGWFTDRDLPDAEPVA